MNRKPLTKKEFEYFYKKMPRLTVELIVLHNDGVVLSKRSIPPDKGYWHIPGGSVMIGERLEDAVHEVAKEELGVEVEILKFIKFFYYPNILDEFGHWPIGAGFLTKIKKGELRSDNDASEIKVFNQIPENVVYDQKEFLNNLVANGFNI